MGLTVSNVTTAASTGSSGTLELTGVSADVGDMLVVMVSCDNSQISPTAGGPPTVSVSDTAGNTYTSRVNANYNAGSAANTGVTNRSFTAPITSALSSGTVTVTFSPNTAAKAVLIKKIVPDAGEQVTYGTNGGTAGTSTTPTITTSSITNGHTVMGFVGIETSEAVTADSDTTNGSWSTQYSNAASTGTNTTSIRIASQQKTVTATATQTYNVSVANTRDWVINWMSFSATALPGFGALLNGLRNRLVIS